MKTSPSKLKSSICLFLCFGAVGAWARPVAQVTALKGQAFKVTAEGKTSSLKVDEHLEERTEIMVEEGASVSLNDYYDASYHLAGGTHLKFFDKAVQLKKGKGWVKAKSAKHPLAVTTANGHVDFRKAEFILTFEQVSSRSQLLVVNGDVDFSNILDKDMKYVVQGGNFSLIDPEVESGLPRAPTMVGQQSLNQALLGFHTQGATRASEVSERPVRAIASVSSPEKPRKGRKGEIIFMSSGRLPASVSGEAHRYFEKKTLKVSKPSAAPVVEAPIRFFGVSAASTVKKVRTPASTIPKKEFKKSPELSKDMNLNLEFTESLKTHSRQQPKHPEELEKLIEELKSY